MKKNLPVRRRCFAPWQSLCLLVLFACTCLWANGQGKVQVRGKIDGYDPASTVYISAGDQLVPLKFSGSGDFTAELAAPQVPACLVFQTVSKKGKIEPIIPGIWVDAAGAEVQINAKASSCTVSPRLAFQDISEKIESLKGKAQNEYLQQQANSLPGMYFIDKQKTSFSPSELQQMLSTVDEAYRETIYGKRIENYIAAKARTPVKAGATVMDFDLPDKQGNAHAVVGDAGRPKLIAMFSSGCMYSIASISLLEQLHQQSQGKLDIVTIWADASKDTWQQAYADKKAAIVWTDLWDEYGFADTYLDKTVSPTFYVVQPDGRLSDKIEGVGNAAVKKLRALVQ